MNTESTIAKGNNKLALPSRRDTLRAGLALGLSALAAPSFLAGCKPSSAGTAVTAGTEEELQYTLAVLLANPEFRNSELPQQLLESPLPVDGMYFGQDGNSRSLMLVLRFDVDEVDREQVSGAVLKALGAVTSNPAAAQYNREESGKIRIGESLVLERPKGPSVFAMFPACTMCFTHTRRVVCQIRVAIIAIILRHFDKKKFIF